jgi:cbb3-type cytochrome oxidase maturation protein
MAPRAYEPSRMEILVLLIPLSVVLALLIGAGFWWSVKSGQFDDLEGPAHRILADDDTSDAIPKADDRPAPQASLTSINPDEQGGR